MREVVSQKGNIFCHNVVKWMHRDQWNWVTIFHLIHFLIIHFYSLDNQTDRSGISNLCKCEDRVEKERKAILHVGMPSFQKWLKKYTILFSRWQTDHILLILVLVVATYCFSWELLLMWKDLVFFKLCCVSGKDVCGF